MKMTKRFLALFLAFLMAFGSFPSVVIAAGEAEIAPAATEEQTAPAPGAPAEPAPAEPATETPDEPASAPAQEQPAPEAPAEPAPEQQPEAPAEPAPEAQPPVEEPAPGQDGYVNEYPSTPSSYTVTWKMTVDGGVLPDIEDVFAPGALLTPPEEAAQYEAQGYELTYYSDELRTQKIDFDVDYIYVSADMTVWVDAVLPAPAEPEVPAVPEQVPAEPEQAPVETEQAPVETEQVPAEPEQVPVEPEQAPAETEQTETEAEQVPVETEQVPAEPEQTEPVAEQPAADLGLPGFELPGVEVPTDVPETEIIAPESQSEVDMNAENGIMPIGTGDRVIMRFEANHGQGTPPADISTRQGDVVIIPGQGSLTRPGYTFAGWQYYKWEGPLQSDNFDNQNIILPNSSYVVPDYWASLGAQRTYYYRAIWVPNDDPGKIIFSIRKDNTIPNEPNTYSSEDYANVGTYSNAADYLYSLQFQYSSSGVTLKNKPSDEEALELAGIASGDFANYEVIWYVVKYDNTGDDKGWHVDGIVREKTKVYLQYDANAAGSTVNNIPTAQSAKKGDTVTVSNSTPTREGYDFVGWKDANGTSYAAGSRITLNATLTLYAQWKPKNGHLTVTKTVKDQKAYYTLGETVNYTITVTNDGNADLTDVTIYDVTLNNLLYSVGNLIKGGSAEWNVTHTITPDDVAAGSFTNTANARGAQKRDGTNVTVSSADASATVQVKKTYDITVTVENGTADPSGSPITVKYGENQTITFTANEGYALESVKVDGASAKLEEGGKYTFDDVNKSHSIQVVYAADGDGDGTPDDFQAEVTYDVVNGTWNDGSKNQKTEKVAFGHRDENGNWVEDEQITLNPPTGMKANTGYKAGVWNPSNFTVSKGVELKFAYTFVEDRDQTVETSYTVYYTIEGVVQAGDDVVVKGKAWVNEDPAMIEIAEGGIPAPADKYKGYKLDPANPGYPAAGTEVESGTEYTVNYVKDESQKKTLKYFVQYFKDNVLEGRAVEFTEEVWVNAPDTLTVQEGSVNTTNYFGKGWIFEKTEPSPVPGTVNNDGTINVYYTADTDGDGTADKYETNQITVTVTNGTANPSDSPIVVGFGKDQKITFTPNQYYTLESVTVNGQPAELAEDGSYTFTNVTENAAIVVVYVLDTYTVTLHDGDSSDPKDVTAGEPFTPDTPEPKDDKLFSGWATEAGGDVDYAPGQSFTVEGDTDLYAVWTAKTPKTYQAYVDISGLPADVETVRAIFQHTDPEPSMSFNLYEKLAGAEEYVQKERCDLKFSGCKIELSGRNVRVYWEFNGYAEDAYQIGEFAYANINFVGDLEVGEYRTTSSSYYNFHYAVKTSGDTLFGNIYYGPNPTYDVTLQLKKWHAEDSSESVIKEVVKSGFHEDDPYDFTADAPAEFDHEGHHYIAINEGGSVLTGKAPRSIPLVRYYARDDNKDNVPDVCQAIITYKVKNGAWNDGSTEDKKIEYRFYVLKNGKWEQNRPTLKFPGGYLDTQTPAVGERPDDGYGEGSWDNAPPTQLKWQFSGDAGKFDMVFTYTYQKVYTVTYTDGVEDVEVFQDQTNTVPEGSETPAFDGTPAWEGHVFTGWLPAVANTVTEDVTYTAQWKVDTDGDGTPDEEETNEITVSVTGGTATATGNNIVDGKITVAFGQDQTITFTANEGYALESVTVDGEPAELKADGSYTFENVTEPHSIEVVFVEDYVVTLHDGETQETVRVPQKSNVLEAPVWEKEGMLFMGWATTDGGEVEYALGASIEVNENMDLYAVWHEAAVLTFYMDVYNLDEANIATLQSHMSLSGEIMNRDNSFYGRSLGEVTLTGSAAERSLVSDGVYRLTWHVTVDGTVLKDIAANGDGGPNDSHTVQLYYKGGFTGIDPVGEYKLSGQDSLAPGKNDPRMTSKSSSSAAANDGEGNPISAYMGRLVYMPQDAVVHTLTIKYVRDTDHSATVYGDYTEKHATGAPYDVTIKKYDFIKNGRTGNVNYAFDEPETGEVAIAALTGIMPDEDLTITLVYSEDRYRPDGKNPGYSDNIPDKYQSYDQDVYVDFFYADESDLERMSYTRSFTLGGTTFMLNWNEHSYTEIVDKAGYGEGVFAQPDKLRVHWTVTLPLVDKANISNKPIPGAAAAVSADGYNVFGGDAPGAVPANAFYNSESYCVDSYTFYALIMYLTNPAGAGSFDPAYYQYLTPHESPYEGAAGYLPKEVTVTENTGYKFLHWVDAEGNVVSETASFTPTLEIQGGRHVNATYTAVFEEVKAKVAVEYYYNGVKGYAPAGKPTELEGRVGTTVTLTPDETLKLTYGKANTTSYAVSEYELDRAAGDTYQAVVEEGGNAVIRVYYKNVMVTGTGRLNIVGLPFDLLPKDAKLYFTVKWKEVKPTRTGGTTSSSKSESLTYTFGQLLDMDCIEYDDNGYHFNVPITVVKGGYVAKNPSASGYNVNGYKVVMTSNLSSDSNKINEDDYSVGMLYSIQYADKGEHTVTIHYLDKLTGENLQDDFMSGPIHGDAEYDFSGKVPKTIVKDGVVYYLFVANLGGSSNLSSAKGTMNDKDIEITAYYSPDKNGDNIPDAAQVFLTFHVVNGAWNDTMREDVTKTVDVYSYNESKERWEYKSVSRASLLPEVGDQPDVGFLAGYNVQNWDFVGSKSFTYRDGGQVFEHTYTYKEDPNFTPTASVSVENTTYGEVYEPEVTTPTGPHGSEYTVSYTYYAKNADDLKGEELDGQPTDAGSYIVEATWTAAGLPTVTAEDTFTVAKKSVTVTAEDKSKVYGEADPDLTFTVPEGALAYEDTADDLQVTLERETGEAVDQYLITGTSDSSNYDVTVEEGIFTITMPGAAAFTPSVSRESYIYGETPTGITFSVVSEQYPALAEQYGEPTFEYTYASLTDENVVNSEEAPVNATKDIAFQGNETIDPVIGLKATWHDESGNLPDLTAETAYDIYTRPVFVNVSSQSKVYDGTPLVLPDPQVMPAGEYSGITYLDMPAGETAVITWKEGTVLSRTDAGFLNVQLDSFDIQVEGGSIKNYSFGEGVAPSYISKRPVMFTSPDLSKEYDGAALVAGGEISTEYDYTNGIGGLVAGETVSYSFTGSRTLPGATEQGNQFTVTWDGSADPKNYSPFYTYGDLTVTDRTEKYEITVKAKSDDTVTYDGTEHSVSGFESLTFEVEGNTYTVEGLEASASGTNAGKYPATVGGTAVVKDADGNDVTAQFTVHTEGGQLTINKKAATVTSASAEKEYDGKALTAPEVTYDGFVEGEGVTGTATGSQTLVGSSANPFTYEANAGTNLDNYEITKTEGTLTVTDRTEKYEITVKAKSDDTVTYDGTEHSVSGFESLTFEVEGNTYTVEGLSASASGTNAGEYPATVGGTAVVKDADGNDVTAQFTVHTEGGQLTINKKAATVTSATASKVYDGTALTAPEVTGAGFVQGEGVTGTATGSQTVAGSSANPFTYEANAGTNLDNYTITETAGTLTVTDRGLDEAHPLYAISVQPNGGNATYDGTEHSVSGFESLTFEVEGSTYTVEGLSASASGTNAGTYPVTVNGTAVVKDADGNDVTAQFDVSVGSASLVIARKAAAVTADDAGKIFGEADPEPLTAAVTGLVAGDSIDYTVTREAGENVGNYTITASGAAVQGNYDVSYDTGVFTIGAKQYAPNDPAGDITVTAPAGTTYSGQPQRPAPVIMDGNTVLREGTDYTLSYSDNTNAGTANVTVTFTGNYAGTASTSFAIAPATVTVTTGSGTKVYDGTALNAAGAITGLVNGETAAVNTASITDAGTVRNDYTIAWGSADADNYTVVEGTIGTLTVTARPVTLTSGSGTKAYDGTALTNFTVAVGGQGFVAGQGAAYTFTGSQTAAGTSANTFTYALTGGAQARNYTITTTNGTLTVTPAAAAAMAVNTPTNYLYTGTAHQWTPTVTGIGGAALTAGTDYTVAYSTGNFTDAGAVTVTVTGIGNYSGTVTRTYQINPRLVILTSGSATKAYDGTALTDNTVTIGGNGFVAGQGAAYTFTGSQTAAGTSANTFTYALTGGAQARNYTITTTNGTLTVTPAAAAAMAVNTPTNYLYTGTAHQWTPTVTGIGGAALTAGTDYTVAYSTGNFTDAGAVTVTVTGIGNYSGTVTRTYQINPRLVILTSASATKTYDGTPLRAQEVTVGGNGFAPGEGATYNVYGQRTPAGTAQNVFSYTLNAGTDADNYTIVQNYGTLTVNDAPDVPAGNQPGGGAAAGGGNTPGGGPAAGGGGAVAGGGNAPGGGPAAGAGGNGPTEIDADDTPLGGQPADEADGGNDAADDEALADDGARAADDAETAEIEEDDTPLGQAPEEDEDPDYTLSEETIITEDDTPLGAAPAQRDMYVQRDCCILHFVLMLAALGVAVYYTHDRKRRQQRQFEVRSEL